MLETIGVLAVFAVGGLAGLAAVIWIAKRWEGRNA